MQVKIAAVGSSPLIAAEIQSAAKLIVRGKLPIQAYSTADVQAGSAADIYVCAQTQMKALQNSIAMDHIFVLDLAPTAKFFIEVSRIPAGQIVYIFNNRLEYTAVLSSYCISLGIEHLHFQAIAYEEMSEEEVKRRLQVAKYIIGVDRFVGNAVLFSAAYRSFLRSDVQIIAGTRTASVRSACALLHGIAKCYHTKLKQGYQEVQRRLEHPCDGKEMEEMRLSAEELVVNAYNAIEIIHEAAVQAIVNQVSAQETFADGEQRGVFRQNYLVDEIQYTLKMAKELNDRLFIIMKKLEKII